MLHRVLIATFMGAAGILPRNDATPSAADTCSFLTTAQVSQALGVQVGAGQPLADKLCTWTETGPARSKKVALTILAANGFAIGKGPLQGTEKPTVSGVGDEAYYKYFSAPRYEKIKVVDLDVKKGGTYFGVEVRGLPMDEAKAAAKTLALGVLAKM
jgi:hypothetical protein